MIFVRRDEKKDNLLLIDYKILALTESTV
jgi:hypothetical protein